MGAGTLSDSRWRQLDLSGAVSLPIGIYSAVRRHSIGDHVSDIFGFLGTGDPEKFHFFSRADV